MTAIRYRPPPCRCIPVERPLYRVSLRRPDADIQFDVRIAGPECPASGVILDATGPSVEIDSLTLDPDCRLDILAGTELRVLEQAFLGGDFFVDGGLVVVADRSVVPIAAAGVGSMSSVVRNEGILDPGGADKIVATGLSVDVYQQSSGTFAT